MSLTGIWEVIEDNYHEADSHHGFYDCMQCAQDEAIRLQARYADSIPPRSVLRFDMTQVEWRRKWKDSDSEWLLHIWDNEAPGPAHGKMVATSFSVSRIEPENSPECPHRAEQLPGSWS